MKEHDEVTSIIESRNTGTAIFNGEPITFLGDGGADKSIMSEQDDHKIKVNNPAMCLEPYLGIKIKSASGFIKNLGVVCLNECILDSEYPINDHGLVVAKLNSSYEGLIGRDLINKINKQLIDQRRKKAAFEINKSRVSST